jgi:hypothetical protein
VNILDDDPYITNVRGISSIDTAVNYTNPQTNQTITTVPAKRADFVITHADRSHSLESILITTAEPPRELLLSYWEERKRGVGDCFVLLLLLMLSAHQIEYHL